MAQTPSKPNSNLIRRWLFWFNDKVGRFKLTRYFHNMNSVYAVVLYHGVENGRDKIKFRPLDLTERAILAEVEFHVNQGYQVCSAVEQKNQVSRHKPGLILTFDDGNRNITDTVIKLSEKYQVQPIIAICPGVIEQHQPFWFEEIQARLLLTQNLKIRRSNFNENVDEPANMQIMEKYFADRRLKSTELLSQIRAETADVNMEQVLQHPAVHQNLTWQELKTLVNRQYCRIAAHTMYHDSVTHMSEQEFSQDLMQCKHLIHKHLGVECDQFIYPFGDSAKDWETRILDESGYRYSYIVDDKINVDTPSGYKLSRFKGRDVYQTPGYYQYLWHLRHSQPHR